jgi:hypothetical protein
MAVGSLLAVSPVFAATLPKGQKLTTVVQFVADNELESTTQMFDTSPVDAAGTPVGNPDGPFILPGIDVDDDGHGFAVQTDITDEFESPVLWQADANTGTFSNPVQIVPTVDITITNCSGIDYQPGVQIIVACFSFLGGDAPESSYIGVVTPDGDFTPFISSGGEDENPVVTWEALARNPVTGELWAFGYEQNIPNVYLVNQAGGTIGEGSDAGADVVSADYDRDGQLFVITAGDGGTYLSTYDPDTASIVEGIGPVTWDDEDLTARALTVWGKEVLPATGADILPLGLGSALLFLAGAALIATHRIRAGSRPAPAD